MKVTITMEKNMVTESSLGLMGQSMTAPSLTMLLKERVGTNGRMVASTKESGSSIR